MPRFVFHLLANAHLDPVWLWDWREGLNEGLTTCATILDLMDEDPELTFIRGEAAIYAHIEQTDPVLFARIRARIEEGRWEVVGGTWIQPDTNLPATETLLRQFDIGRGYFASRFGKRATPTVAWAADSFGHSAGLPDILSASGMEAIMFCRPQPEIVPISKPVFWWEGCGGSRILACRPLAPYLSEHGQVPELLDAALAAAANHGLVNIAFPYGVGNHGGGPTRRQLRDIAAWAGKHPEVRVEHSGMHRFFREIRRELKTRQPGFIPTHQGELNFCLRGCYASVAKFKFAYRKMEAGIVRAETTSTILAAALEKNQRDFTPGWLGVLFNSFHDILPGSSIERAYEDQLAQVGSVTSESQAAEFAALNQLANRVDTSVRKPEPDRPSAVPVLLWNPHPRPFEGPVEIEAAIDYRPVSQYRNRSNELPLRLLDSRGRRSSFQTVATEHAAFESSPWRKRIVTKVKIPALGWTVLEVGWVEGSSPPSVPNPATAPQGGTIDNGIYRVEARKGAKGLEIFLHGRPLFPNGGLSVATFADPWGSWGGMLEEPESFTFGKPEKIWKISAVETLESGPERAALWVRFVGGNSRLDLTIQLCRERAAVDFKARLFVNERDARIKLIFPQGGDAEFEVPGGSVLRKPCGEVPGGRWIRVTGRDGSLGFASDGLYSFDVTPDAFRPTLARASRYAATRRMNPKEKLWMPAVDAGELCFQFLLQPGDANLPALAAELEQPPVVQIVPPRKGEGLGRSGSLASLSPPSARLLSLRPSGKCIHIRIQLNAARRSGIVLQWFGRPLPLGFLRSGEIGVWKLSPAHGGQWKANRLATH